MGAFYDEIPENTVDWIKCVCHAVPEPRPSRLAAFKSLPC